MSKPWYYTIGYPVKVFWKEEWKSGIITNGYRHEDGIINTVIENGEKIWFPEARKNEFLKPNLPDDNQWIPIGESLPEENQKVWVTNEYHGGSRRVEESVYKNNEFYETGYLNRDIVSTDLVKAWCPRFVPEPYKEVSEE